jgi:hypothetical protein
VRIALIMMFVIASIGFLPDELRTVIKSARTGAA